MSSDTSTTRSDFTPILILLGGFGLLLFVLLVGNLSTTNRITPQNVQRLHEVLRLDSGSSGTPPLAFALSPDNDTLLVTTSSENELWRLKAGGKQVMSLLNAGGFTSLLYFDGDQPRANFSNWTGSISFLDLEDGHTIQGFDGLYSTALYAQWNVSPDHRWFVSSHSEIDLSVTDIKTGATRFTIRPPLYFNFRSAHPTFSSDGQWLALSLIHDEPHGFAIFLVDTATGKNLKQVATLEPGTGLVEALAFSHDGKYLAIGGNILSNDRHTSLIKLVDLEHNTELATWYGNGISVQNLSFTLDDQTILASGYGDVWVWDIPEALKTGKPRLHLEDKSGSGVDYYASTLSHDGSLLAVSTPTNGIWLFDVQTATQIKTLSGHSGIISQLTFSDDDEFLVSSSYDHTVRFWSVGNNNPYPLIVHPHLESTAPAPIMTPTIPG